MASNWPKITQGMCSSCLETGLPYGRMGRCQKCANDPQAEPLADYLSDEGLRRARKNPLRWVTKNFGRSYVLSVLEINRLPLAVIDWVTWKSTPDVDQVLRVETERLIDATYRRWRGEAVDVFLVAPTNKHDVWALGNDDPFEY